MQEPKAEKLDCHLTLRQWRTQGFFRGSEIL